MKYDCINPYVSLKDIVQILAIARLCTNTLIIHKNNYNSCVFNKIVIRIVVCLRIRYMLLMCCLKHTIQLIAPQWCCIDTLRNL